MSMHISVHVDQAEAIRRGIAAPCVTVVSISSSDLQSWSQEVRDLFALSLKPGNASQLSELCTTSRHGRQYNGTPLYVVNPTPDGIRDKLESVLAEFKQQCEAEAADEARRATEHGARDAELAAAPIDEQLMEDPYAHRSRRWGYKEEVRGELRKYYPLYLARIENELKVECERRNAEEVAKHEQEKAAQKKAEDDAIEALRQWALEHGSELTKARIAEGFDSWQSSALADRARLVEDYADSIIDAVPIEHGEEPEHDDYRHEPRLSPTLKEIEALRIARANVPTDVVCELVHETYTKRAVGICGREVDPKQKEFRTAIKFEIRHEFGTATRTITLK